MTYISKDVELAYLRKITSEHHAQSRRPIGGIGTESALITSEYRVVEAGLKLASQLPQLSGNLDKIITSSKTR